MVDLGFIFFRVYHHYALMLQQEQESLPRVHLYFSQIARTTPSEYSFLNPHFVPFSKITRFNFWEGYNFLDLLVIPHIKFFSNVLLLNARWVTRKTAASQGLILDERTDLPCITEIRLGERRGVNHSQLCPLGYLLIYQLRYGQLGSAAAIV